MRRWEAQAFSSVSFQVPDNWKAGRIWVRLLQVNQSSILVADHASPRLIH